MTKRDILLEIARQKPDIKQEDIKQIIQLTLDLIADTLGSGEDLEFRNFGIFKVIERKAKIGRNPKNPSKEFKIPARKVIKFKSGKKINDLLKNK